MLIDYEFKCSLFLSTWYKGTYWKRRENRKKITHNVYQFTASMQVNMLSILK